MKLWVWAFCSTMESDMKRALCNEGRKKMR